MNTKAETIVSYMNANLHRKISLAELAGVIRTSRSHLCQLLKRETGMPPGQYLKMLRLQKAATLLATTWMPIKEVMWNVGYNDKGLFIRHFKTAHGLTPSQYRAVNFDRGAVGGK